MLPPVFLLEVLKVRPWLMILQKKGTMGESHSSCKEPNRLGIANTVLQTPCCAAMKLTLFAFRNDDFPRH